MTRFDLAVVGAGILGLAPAYYAARANRRVALLDRSPSPAGATVRNFGMVIPGALAPGAWRERAGVSVAFYEELAAAGVVTITGRGTIYLARTALEAAVLTEFAALAPSHGYTCDRLDRATALRLVPALKSSGLESALVFPEDIQIDQRSLPSRLIPWLIERLGMTWLPAHEAVTIHGGKPATIAVKNGTELLADRVVVCPGAEPRTLSLPGIRLNGKSICGGGAPLSRAPGEGLGVRAGVRRCVLQMLRTQPMPDVALPHAIASGWSLRRYEAFRLAPSWADLDAAPMPDDLQAWGIHVLVKQEVDGSITIGDSHGLVDLDEPDPAPDPAIDAAILREARSLVRLPDWSVAERWTGAYLAHPILEGIVEEVEDNVTVVAVLGGKGMTCGPGLAREVVGGWG
ncbi:MAG: FAD-dependent oxidoreductase [Chloroflexia bacterium]|nr:FAD-dependent oxidoreductase [Chloroflexia bacterium]